MVKRIPAVKARQQFGTLLDDVRLRGVEYLIERGEKPIAMVVSLEQYRRFQAWRQDAFDRLEGLRDQLAEQIDASELETLIEEAVQEVREERKT